MAVALKTAVRNDDLVARTGGEEFVVLTLVQSLEPAVALAERLRHAVGAVDGVHHPTASIGLALTRPWAPDLTDVVAGPHAVDATWRLLDRADSALYEAKRQGRDRWVLDAAARQLAVNPAP